MYKREAIFITLFLLIVFSKLDAQFNNPQCNDLKSRNLNVIQSIVGGCLHAVELNQQENIAYLLNGTDLIILDISNIDEPIELDKIFIGMDGNLLFLHDTYIYITSNTSGLHIINVSNPQNVFEICNLYSNDTITDIDFIDNYAFIALNDNELRVIDVSETITPIEISSLNFAASINNVIIEEDYLYVIREDVLFIIDISNLYNLSVIGSYSTDEELMKGLNLTENYLYFYEYTLGDEWDPPENYLSIIDISNPSNPYRIQKKTLNPNLNYRSLTVLDNNAILVVSNILYIYDITDNLNFFELSNIQINIDYIKMLRIQNNHAYVIGKINFHYYKALAVNLSDPYSPQIEGEHNLPIGVPDDFAVTNNNIFVANDDSGLRILNIENSSLFFEEGFFDESINAIDVVYKNNYAYVLGKYDKLQIWEVSNISSPTLIGTYYYNDMFAKKIFTHDEYVYFTLGTDAFIIDVSNPTNPVNVGCIDTYGEIDEIAFQDDYLFLYEINLGFTIFDNSIPTEPIQLSYCMGVSADDFVIKDNYAYLAQDHNSDDGLYIIDFCNIYNPYVIGYYPLQDATSLDIIENFVYIHHSQGLSLVDISTPSEPIEIDNFSIAGYHMSFYNEFAYATNIYDLTIYDINDPLLVETYTFPIEIGNTISFDNNYVYIPFREYGVSICEFDGSLNNNENTIKLISKEIQIFPNPFNPSTTIVFSIQNDSQIELAVFNVKGQRVKSLIQRVLTKGTHSFIWNGDDEFGNSVTSGIYFFKLNVNGTTKALKKCLLLK